MEDTLLLKRFPDLPFLAIFNPSPQDMPEEIA